MAFLMTINYPSDYLKNIKSILHECKLKFHSAGVNVNGEKKKKYHNKTKTILLENDLYDALKFLLKQMQNIK